jgi:hypothetical protein
MKYLMILVSILTSSAAFAGGSSTAGVGAPQFLYACLDTELTVKEFQANVIRASPNYELELAILDFKGQSITSEPVEQIQPKAVGAPMIYQGATSSLSLNSSIAPIFEDGKVYTHGILSQAGKPDRNLKCAYVGKQ